MPGVAPNVNRLAFAAAVVGLPKLLGSTEELLPPKMPFGSGANPLVAAGPGKKPEAFGGTDDGRPNIEELLIADAFDKLNILVTTVVFSALVVDDSVPGADRKRLGGAGVVGGVFD